MMRNLAASWLFAGFLVVVAVATWRLLDAARFNGFDEPACAAAASPSGVGAPLPVAPPAVPGVVPPRPQPVDPFDADRDRVPVGMARLQLGTQPFAQTFIDGRSIGSTPFYGPHALTLALGEHELRFQDKTTGRWFGYRLELNADDPENKLIVVLRDGEREPAHPPMTSGALRVREDTTARTEPQRGARSEADHRARAIARAFARDRVRAIDAPRDADEDETNGTDDEDHNNGEDGEDGENDENDDSQDAADAAVHGCDSDVSCFADAVDAFRERRRRTACALLEHVLDDAGTRERWRGKAQKLHDGRCGSR